MSLSVFLPLRKGSQRVIEKNVRPFTFDNKSLFQLKLEQILGIKEIKEIVISTDDDEVIEQISKSFTSNKIVIDKRPKSLCLSTTLVKDLINYVPSVTKGKHILWVHATSPFVEADDYNDAIIDYYKALNKGYDSIMSVTEHKQFLWSDIKKKIINTDDTVNKWPNTQDLEPLYEINHAFYINSRENYIKNNDRIGENPYLYILDGEKTMDIDWEKDFIFAQKIYKALKENQ